MRNVAVVVSCVHGEISQPGCDGIISFLPLFYQIPSDVTMQSFGVLLLLSPPLLGLD